eukprot:s135_g21.t1
MLEQPHAQLQIDTMDTRIKTLEARLGNRSILLKGLPATGFTKYNLDWNIKCWGERSNVPFDSIASMPNHLLNSNSTIPRLEFTTETYRSQFYNYIKNSRLEWGINRQRYRVKAEPDISTSDRLAKQPFYTLLELFRQLLPDSDKGPQGQHQSDINIQSSSTSLLSQVSYILDLSFHRRYVCVIFVIEQYLLEIQDAWQDAFNSTMDTASQMIHALSRADIGRTTAVRFSCDKAFDISNTKVPSSTFPYPILFMPMSQTLANLLSTHPQLPLQGSLGLSRTLQQLFMQHQIDSRSYGKANLLLPYYIQCISTALKFVEQHQIQHSHHVSDLQLQQWHQLPMHQHVMALHSPPLGIPKSL